MTTDAVGGVWQYSLDLAAGLAGYGAAVLLVTMGPRPSVLQREQAQALRSVALLESDYSLEWMEHPWRDVDAAGEWLLKVQGDYRADMIHLNGYSHAALPWNKPVVSVAHSCVFSWWRAVHRQSPGVEWAEYKARVSAGIAAASAMVAPSFAMGNDLRVDYGVAADKVSVIRNFSYAPQLSFENKRPFLLGAGRIWDQAKNWRTLAGLRSQFVWELQIADGTLAHCDLLREMATASIFVHPSLYEPFGIGVLEAARSHCCLVLSDIPSLRELWEGAAVFVDPRDEGMWVREINDLCRDGERREKFAHLAFSKSAEYRASDSIAEYWQLYQQLRSGQALKEETAA